MVHDIFPVPCCSVPLHAPPSSKLYYSSSGLVNGLPSIRRCVSILTKWSWMSQSRSALLKLVALAR
eukprot:2984260-Pleurochrysis_carterae.AAC.1